MRFFANIGLSIVVTAGCALADTVISASRESIAEFRIGYSYERGQGMAKDYAEAMRHYLIAAAEGNPVAEFRIGYLYEKGLGVSPDPVLARQWYAKAASHGDDHAQRKLDQ
ncbi:MAG: tetratricopeptide repeat protein [Rhizomicrobium sp.]|nr:tetratricopeptide repeat protein [Rhizomicrobium sp.]